MSKRLRRSLLSILLWLPAAAAFASVSPAAPAPPPPAAPAIAAPPTEAMDRLPDPVVYGQMFRHVVALGRKAEAAEQKGEDGSRFRLLYRQKAALDDDQDRRLQQIAGDCMAQVEQQDKKARQLIAAARAQTGAKLLPGQAPPAPPAELKGLQAERDALILAARDRLHAAFGEDEFQRFDQFVRRTIAPHIRLLKGGRE
ncbi:MAG TPA: hypothetical protein VOA87_09215 [Thermoanaerobaculia bacterium]|nr:hypothetical protein [Thermoanaerobaculia bacterium]